MSAFPHQETLSILLVEDNQSDAALFQIAMSRSGAPTRVDVVSDGEDAMQYLLRQGAYAENAREPLPCLIVLDLNLPRMSGLEVAKLLKTIHPLRRIPIVFLTSSAQAADRDAAYDNGANSYLEKTGEPGRLDEIANLIRRYWLEFNVPADTNR